MKRTLFLFSFLIYLGCKCIQPQDLPIQIVHIGPDCNAPLPDYRGYFTAWDNCGPVTMIQDPGAGLILTPENPYVQVRIIATDFSDNTDIVTFDAILLDTIPPVISVDTSFYTYDRDNLSDLLTAYHNGIGRELERAALGPDSVWTQSLLRDTAYLSPNPFYKDSVFTKKKMIMIWEPGFNASSVGTFVEPGKFIAGLDSSHLKTLGFWPLITIKIGTEPTPLHIDAAGPLDDWFTQDEGGVVFKYVGAPWDLADMYKSERYGIFNYNIPIGRGRFLVELHFAEIYWTQAGQRVFDVSIQGKRVLDDFDIFQESGGAWKPITKTFTIDVTDGWINIDFPAAAVDYAKLSGISITKINAIIAAK